MDLLSLPNEIFLQVVDDLPDERAINSLARVNKRLYQLLNDYLYRYNIQYQRSDALPWAIKRGSIATVRRLIRLGADLETKGERTRRPIYYHPFFDHRFGGYWQTPLYLAIEKGCNATLKLLLNAGVNTNVTNSKGWNPLYTAIRLKRESVARSLCKCCSGMLNTSITSEGDLTPLHATTEADLLDLALFLLEEGANVDSNDSKGRTPLYYAFVLGRLKIAKLLLRYGANTNFKVISTDETKSTTLRNMGELHQDIRFRELFGVYSNSKDRVHGPVKIGRSWMGHSEENCASDWALTRYDSVKYIRDGMFPSLETSRYVREAAISPKLGILISTSSADTNMMVYLDRFPSWAVQQVTASPNQGTSNLVAYFDETTKPLARVTIIEAPRESPKPLSDPFPRLSNHSTTHCNAGDIWKSFRDPKHKGASSLPLVEVENSNIGGPGGQNTGAKRAKGKKKWQTLKL
jgi:ankyrin repeat protein